MTLPRSRNSLKPFTTGPLPVRGRPPVGDALNLPRVRRIRQEAEGAAGVDPDEVLLDEDPPEEPVVEEPPEVLPDDDPDAPDDDSDPDPFGVVRESVR
jgi:hypothetical protein